MPDTIKRLSEALPLRDDRYGTVFEIAGRDTGLPHLGFAWVEVDIGAASPDHFHKFTSELYHIVEGTGIMTLDGEEHPVKVGDCVSVVPGVIHAVRNTGETVLKFFCATSPSYDPDDDYEC